MRIRITTVRQLPNWDLKQYCQDMAGQGVPPCKVEEFYRTGKCFIIFGNPNSETYNITSYEVLDNVAPVKEIKNERNEGKADPKICSSEEHGVKKIGAQATPSKK